jgi:hypothetical protein
MVDVRKCLWVADKALMRRHTKIAYAFAADLATKVRMLTENIVLCTYWSVFGGFSPSWLG